MEKAAVMWSRVLVSIEPAWPMGRAMNSKHLQYFLRASIRGGVFLALFFYLDIATEVSAKYDFHDDEGALLLDEIKRLGLGRENPGPLLHRCGP